MRNILLSLLLLLFFSCEFVRELEIGTPVSKAVLNGIIFSDSVFQVNVSVSSNVSSYETSPETGFLFEPKILFIEDAEIAFFLNGKLQGNLDRLDEKGNYWMPDYTPRPGDEISLEVKTDKYETLQSKTRIPQPVQILQIDTTVYTINESLFVENNKGIHIDMDICINKEEKSYYLLALSSWCEYVTEDKEGYAHFYENFILYPFNLSSHPDTYYLINFVYPLGFTWKDLTLYSNYVIFSSDTFEKEVNRLSLRIEGVDLSYYDENISVTKYYKVHVMSISSSFYRYLHSKQAQYENNDLIIESDVYGLYPTFSNVEGGYGLFSSVAESSCEIILQPGEYLPFNLRMIFD